MFIWFFYFKQNFYCISSGYFAYIEASRPRNEGDRSILTSPYLRTTNGCLVFWYHMMGANIGRLRLYLASNSTSKVVFEKKGHISRRWMFQKVELNLVTTPFVNSGYQVRRIVCIFSYSYFLLLFLYWITIANYISSPQTKAYNPTTYCFCTIWCNISQCLKFFSF